jgi:dihydrofolate synthase/folylpolyglutamate synthase
MLVLDGAHNAESAFFLRQSLDLHFRYDRLHLVVGVFSDKDLKGILRLLLPASSLTAVELAAPRARPAEQVARMARRLGMSAKIAEDVGSAIDSLVREAAPRDLICVTGSLALVAAAREALGLARHGSDP